MRRRDFIAAFGSAAIAWPLAARAQQAAKLPTIGFLGSATPASWSPWLTVFVQRLRELGWTEGRNVAIEVRWGEGRSDRFSEIGHDTRALQAYLGHKNIRHTVHYTELAPDRFKDFWR